MLTHRINPVAFSIGPFQVRWYGIIFVFGFFLAYLFLLNAIKTNKIKNLKREHLAELILYLLIGVLIGSRAMQVLYYEPRYYFTHPLEMFAIWRGGLSFHGGLLGAVLMGWIFCKKRKISFYQLADVLAVSASLALFFGRIGNFINAELYGKISNVPWCVRFPTAPGCRHPSQLYEAGKNLFNFFILGFILKRKFTKKLRDGIVFWHFILLYGILRFSIEFFRYWNYYFLGLSKGQWLCLGMIAVAIPVLVRWKIRKEK